MPQAVELRPLRTLRRQRAWLSRMALAVLVVGLAGTFGQCLLGSPGAMAQAAPAPAEASMPCHPCTLGSDPGTLDEMALLSAHPNVVLYAAVFLAVVLLWPRKPRALRVPPRPLLPGRPRTLEFYALRI